MHPSTLLLLLIVTPALLFPFAHSSSPTESPPVRTRENASPFPINITDSYRANWTSLSTSHISGGDTGIVRFDLTDLLDSGYTLVDTLHPRNGVSGAGVDQVARIVSGSWDVMIDVQSFGSKTVSQVIASFKVFGVYNTATGRLVLQSVRESASMRRACV
jgi:hypothetical protein